MLQRITVCLLLAVSMLFPLHVHAATIQLPVTGQTASYGTGDDGAKQNGAAWPSPRFTDNGNGTVTDNLTGLIWLKNANCNDTVAGIDKSGGTPRGTLSWANALTWSNNLASGACGLNDGSTAGQWRLPNRKELQSLIDRSMTNPALPSGHPFTGVRSGAHWSSSSYANVAHIAWSVDLGACEVFYGDKANTFFVLPVRAGQ